MPRISQPRAPAEPSSPLQRERQRRILRAAARLGTTHGIDRVQMHDVAREARVAIGTLYRYFPSKTHLFAGLLRAEVDRLRDQVPVPPPHVGRAEAVADLLISSADLMLARPRLTHAMLQATTALVGEDDAADLDALPAVHDLLLRVARLSEPSPAEQQRLRLVEMSWYGILTSALTGHLDRAQAAADTRVACRSLLGDLDRPADSGPPGPVSPA